MAAGESSRGSVCLAGWLAGCLAEVVVRRLGDPFFLFEEKKKLHLVEYFTTHSFDFDCTIA